MPNLERLKLIQTIIDRMARNSFALKGWTITLTSALLSLAATRDDQTIAAIAIYVLAAMATLDAYYLALERAYRQLYQQATTQPDSEWALQPDKITPTDVAHALTSPSIVLLYGLSLTATLATIIGRRRAPNDRCRAGDAPVSVQGERQLCRAPGATVSEPAQGATRSLVRSEGFAR